MECKRSNELIKEHGSDPLNWKIDIDNSLPECLCTTCKALAEAKIKHNIEEYKEGRYSSPQQAVAVGYAQARKAYPKCVECLTKK